MTIDEMLQRRDEVYLEWDEPWASLPSDGETREVSVTCRATVDACIDIERLHYHQYGLGPPHDEAVLLRDFIESYGARGVGEAPDDTDERARDHFDHPGARGPEASDCSGGWTDCD